MPVASQIKRHIRRRREVIADTTIRGADLAAASIEAGVKGAEIARRMGVSRQYVHKLERLDEVPPDAAERYLAALKPVG